MHYNREESTSGHAAVRKHLTAMNSIINSKSLTTPHINSMATHRDRRIIQPHYQYMRRMQLPSSNMHNPADAVCSHFLLHGFNRQQKAPVHTGCWSSDGRRLVLGTQLGEFNLWEGDTFKFEKLVTTHQNPIRAMAWSTNGQMLLSGDHEGIIKYFNASMTNVRNLPDAHEGAVRGLSFSPMESKYASCSDDSSVKIWDWEKATPDVEYRDEHLSDVKCCQWHPYRSLVASGSKDNTVKLWDPRETKAVSTIHGHKNTVLCCSWNRSGNWLATGSRDHLIKVYDLRTMTEFATLRGHQKEVSALQWHPHQEALLMSGGFNGTLIYWTMGYQGPHTIIANAHNYSVNVIAWHPLGHCVGTAANDGILKFWCREPPGSSLKSELNEWQDASLALKITYGPQPAAVTGEALAAASEGGGTFTAGTGGSATGNGISDRDRGGRGRGGKGRPGDASGRGTPGGRVSRPFPPPIPPGMPPPASHGPSATAPYRPPPPPAAFSPANRGKPSQSPSATPSTWAQGSGNRGVPQESRKRSRFSS